jgi:hypothetical protein
MKTNTGQNRCTTIGSTTCMKYTGDPIPSLGIYCDDDLNAVLDVLFAKVIEIASSKGLDLSTIDAKCTTITTADKSNLVTVLNKIIAKLCELELVASGDQTISTVKVLLNNIDPSFWSCIDAYTVNNPCVDDVITLQQLLGHIISEFCNKFTDLETTTDSLNTNSLTTGSSQWNALLGRMTAAEENITDIQATLDTIDSTYDALTIQATDPTTVSDTINMLISAVDKVKTELFSSSAGISNIDYAPDSTLVTNLTTAHTSNGGSSGDISFSNIENSIESLMRVLIQMNNACKLSPVSASVGSRNSSGAVTSIKVQLQNYRASNTITIRRNRAGNNTSITAFSYSSTTGTITFPDSVSNTAYTTIVSGDIIEVTEAVSGKPTCIVTIGAPDTTSVTIPAS